MSSFKMSEIYFIFVRRFISTEVYFVCFDGRQECRYLWQLLKEMVSGRRFIRKGMFIKK